MCACASREYNTRLAGLQIHNVNFNTEEAGSRLTFPVTNATRGAVRQFGHHTRAAQGKPDHQALLLTLNGILLPQLGTLRVVNVQFLEFRTAHALTVIVPLPPFYHSIGTGHGEMSVAHSVALAVAVALQALAPVSGAAIALTRVRAPDTTAAALVWFKEDSKLLLAQLLLGNKRRAAVASGAQPRPPC